jgi:hypothetical protein
MAPSTVNTVIYTKASASLNEEVAKELKISDPKEKSLASLIKKTNDESDHPNEREG